MKWLYTLTMTAAALAATVMAAKADVIFTATQVGAVLDVSGNDTAVQASMSLTMTDDAYASGGAFRYSNRVPTLPPTAPSWMTGFSIKLENVQNPLDVDLYELTRPINYGEALSGSIDLTIDPDGLLRGTVSYFSMTNTIRFVFDGTASVTGVVNSDYKPCWLPCTFDSVQTVTQIVTPVPEPASLALFGVGVAGLGMIRRRRTQP